jgi:hypothetical protein
MTIHTIEKWFPNALLLLFIALKLSHNIDWSWILVLSPFWGNILFQLVIAWFAWKKRN